VGRKHHTTVGAVALRWTLQQPGVAAVSVGCRLGSGAFDADGALQVSRSRERESGAGGVAACPSLVDEIGPYVC
jgi:aryl-alcohol dehydrogenase-like predicted oxidoreductase